MRTHRNHHDDIFNSTWSNSGVLQSFYVFESVCKMNPHKNPQELIERYSPALRDQINNSARHLDRLVFEGMEQLS